MRNSLHLIWLLLPACLLLRFQSPTPPTQVQVSGDDKLYLGQKLPGHTAEVFAPGLISLPGRYEFGCTFSRDGKEFFFAVDHGGKNTIYQSVLKNGVWTEPTPPFNQDRYGYNDPMLTPEEKRLFFISNQPLDGKGAPKDIDIWYVERQGTGWSAPIPAGPYINTAGEEYFCSFAEDGTLYFASNTGTAPDKTYNHDIYAAAPDGKGFKKPVKLNGNINTSRYEPVSILPLYPEN